MSLMVFGTHLADHFCSARGPVLADAVEKVGGKHLFRNNRIR
jgi:hypothetical protein